MKLGKVELLVKASSAATEQVNGEILFLWPDVYFELNDPRGSYECYYYYTDEKNTSMLIIVQAINGAVIVTEHGEDNSSY